MKSSTVFFYKEIMYKPLPDGVTIKHSPIHGFGLYASKRINKGTLIGITHHIDPNSQDGVIRTPLGGFGNHSDNSNCFKLLMESTICGMKPSTWWIGAKEDIEEDEEITWTYTLYNPTGEEIMDEDQKRKNLNHANALKKEIKILQSRIEPRETGHLHTAISVLTHRIEELQNG